MLHRSIQIVSIKGFATTSLISLYNIKEDGKSCEQEMLFDFFLALTNFVYLDTDLNFILSCYEQLLYNI